MLQKLGFRKRRELLPRREMLIAKPKNQERNRQPKTGICICSDCEKECKKSESEHGKVCSEACKDCADACMNS